MLKQDVKNRLNAVIIFIFWIQWKHPVGFDFHASVDNLQLKQLYLLFALAQFDFFPAPKESRERSSK